MRLQRTPGSRAWRASETRRRHLGFLSSTVGNLQRDLNKRFHDLIYNFKRFFWLLWGEMVPQVRMKARKPGRGTAMTVQMMRLVRLRRQFEGVADGLDVGRARATARLWPEPESKVVLFPNGEDLVSVGTGVGEW